MKGSSARFRASWIVATALFPLLVTSARANDQSFQEVLRQIPGFRTAGAGRFAIADFDGDAKTDIVIPAQNATALLEVVGRTRTGIGAKQIVILEDVSLARVIAHAIDGQPHLFTFSTDGTVREFAGWPLRQLRATRLENTMIWAAAIGDVDADGNDEVVIASDGPGGSFLEALDLTSLNRRWALPNVSAPDILLTQLDADPALEIVVGYTPGLVIDGATRAIDWSYVDGFGPSLASGHFQDGGGGQFVTTRNWNLFAVFQSAPYSPLWDVSRPTDIDVVTTADLDDDGYDEILEGDGQWGDLNVYDGRTRQIRLSLPNSGHGFNAIAALNLDGGYPNSIAYSPKGVFPPSSPLFTIVDASSGNPIWSIDNSRPGPFLAATLGDVDSDGSIDFLYSSVTQDSCQITTQVDSWTGALEWMSPPPSLGSTDPYCLLPQALHVVDRPGASPQIVLAGTAVYDGRILAIDGASHALLWQVGPMQNRFINDIIRLDVDHDGTDEIVACTTGTSSGMDGIRLLVFSSASGAQLWESVALGSFGACRGVMAGRFDNSSAQLIAAVLPDSIRAFDAQTHLLAWSLPLPAGADGATLINAGVDGREFAVFSGSRLDFYDSATRSPLRHFDFSASLTAITAMREMGESIHTLLVSADGRLLTIDGETGAILASSDFLGSGLGANNQLATKELGDGRVLIGASSQAGAFVQIATLRDAIFTDGFQSTSAL